MLPSSTRPHGGLSDAQCRLLRSHVRDRLNEDLGLIELASLVGLRPRHFFTLFQRAFGTTPHRYILRQRLDRGARMLAQGERDVESIA